MPQNSGVNNFSYYIETYGCTYNQSDSEKIIAVLNQHGFKLVALNDADFLILNTCAVKQSTESKIIQRIEFIAQQFPQKNIIITGCLPEIGENIKDRIYQMIKGRGFFVHPREITKIGEFLNGFIKSGIENIKQIDIDKSFVNPEINSESRIGLVQISEGCIYNCSYCCTKLARGKLISFNLYQITKQVKYFIEHNVFEIHLTSQDLGIYNFQGHSLIDLLSEIIKLPGEFLIRLGMLNPTYLILNIKSILKILETNKFFRFLHIPIQSGSNDILKKMKRPYKIEAMDGILKDILTFDPKFTFSTDIITGFPTESEQDHQKTIDFINKWQPDVLNISKYTNRPNTEAKKLPQLDSRVIKERSKEITSIYESYLKEKMKKWIGWEGRVYIDQILKDTTFTFSGRNIYNKQILLKDGELGKFIFVKIIDTSNYSLIGQKV